MDISKQKIKEVIDDLKKIQLGSGSKDDYGQGMYNGMELIKATLLGIQPEYMSKEWKVRRQENGKTNQQ